MNFKAMNMKKGFIRLWIIGSVYWVLDPFDGYVFGTKIPGPPYIASLLLLVCWWALLYLGFWVARGFADDDDKKAGF